MSLPSDGSPSPEYRGCCSLGNASEAAFDLIDRETIGERLDPFLDRSFDQRRLAVLRRRDRAQHFCDHAADLLELGNTKTARGRGRRTEPQAGGDERLLGIE